MTIFQVQLPREEINATRICSFLTELTKKNKVKVVRLEQICVGNKVSNLELVEIRATRICSFLTELTKKYGESR
jgi:hypothetical protein